MAEDQERLIAEALRAQAADRLLSGNDLPLPVVAPTMPVGTVPGTRRIEPHRGRIPVLAILLIAAALGLAAGAVIGLLTLF